MIEMEERFVAGFVSKCLAKIECQLFHRPFSVIGTDVFLSGPETRSLFGQETETRAGTGIVRGKK